MYLYLLEYQIMKLESAALIQRMNIMQPELLYKPLIGIQ